MTGYSALLARAAQKLGVDAHATSLKEFESAKEEIDFLWQPLAHRFKSTASIKQLRDVGRPDANIKIVNDDSTIPEMNAALGLPDDARAQFILLHSVYKAVSDGSFAPTALDIYYFMMIRSNLMPRLVDHATGKNSA